MYYSILYALVYENIESTVSARVRWKNPSRGMMANSNGESLLFLSHPHTNNGLFFLLAIKYHILCLKRLPAVSEYAEMRHGIMPPL